MVLRRCEVVVYAEHFTALQIQSILLDKSTIKDYAYILHNKDTKEDGSIKKEHFHIMLRFKSPCDSNFIAKWFDYVNDSNVSKIKGRWNDALKYLTHLNSPDKFQYDFADVFANFDYSKQIEKTDYADRKTEIIQGIINGDIREYNYYEYIDGEEYVKYKNVMDSAFKYRIDKIKGSDRDMQVIYITGASGTGKSTYAKVIAKQKGYSVAESSGSNDPLDGYAGQDCLILDELRPECMGLSDLLKMTDNNTQSTVKSRYRNKVLECKLIIITSILPIEEFFRRCFASDNEPIAQLERRCKTYIRMDKKQMYIRLFDDIDMKYSEEIISKNPVADMFKSKHLDEKQKIAFIEDLLGVEVDVNNTYSQEELSWESESDIPFK